MLVSNLLKFLLAPYMSYVVPGEGGGADRGDDFTPTLDEEDEKPDPKSEKTDEEDEKPDTKSGKKDETEDDGEEEDEEEDKKQSKPRIKIPKERLDQEIAKRRAAEQRFAEREQALLAQIEQQRKDADVDALEKELTKLDEQYDDAIADGEKGKAKELKAKMREIERKISRAEAIQASIQSKQAAVAEIRYDMAVSEVETDYPELNPDHESFDADKAEEVMDMLEAFKLKRIAPDVALKRAVRYVMGPPKRLVEKAEEEVPDIEKDGLRRKAKEERALDARKKVADVVKKQPPSTAKVGADSDKMGEGGKLSASAVAKMSHEQFVKLDEETKARLRGDDL